MNIPLRTCALTRKKLPKDTLLRIIRTPAGTIEFDSEQNKEGRGLYIVPEKEKIGILFSEKKKGLWKYALKCDISSKQKSQIKHAIEEFIK